MRHWPLLGCLLIAFLVFGASHAQERRRPEAPRLPEGTKVIRDLPYVSGGHERQKLDLYLPTKAKETVPLIVWVHGGAWRAGNKDRCPAVFMVPRGYAVASLNYRLSEHAVFPAQIEDCKAAIRWLRANAKNYNINPDRIGAWGASAGGHLVALLGTAGDAKELEGKGGNAEHSSRVQAVCDWFGPTDLRGMPARRGNADSPVTKLLGGPATEKKELAAKASPTNFVTPDDPPFLIMHGDNDQMVSLRQSELLAQALKKAGVEVTLQTLKGAAHGGPQFLNAENRKLIEDFFDRHLRTSARK